MEKTPRPDLAALIGAHPARQDALLPLLHALQDALGWVPPEATPLIARHLNLSRAEVHGVISFYHHFRTAPPGRQVLEICRAEACQARGSETVVAHAKATLGIDDHQTTADGAITLEPVYCLGNCACGPNLRLGDTLHSRMDCAGLEALLQQIRQEAP